MSKQNVIAIFDVGKTNKKLFLFDEQYKMVYEESTQLQEIEDEDGFPCEDVEALTLWVRNSFKNVLKNDDYQIKAVNFSGYGASFVYIDEQLKVMVPLYSYLKPYSKKLREKFYNTYGGESSFAKQAASPVLGNLNSGMQLYRLKYEKPELFSRIKYALHLPQYLSFILTGKPFTDITSIGCHTNLWDFQKNQYHEWVKDEGVEKKLPPIINSDAVVTYIDGNIPAGIGLHDSSASLIPYLISFNEPFLLLSTGTWCITFNPFNNKPLTDFELEHDCLCNLSYKGQPVKASRLFAGYEHELQIKKLAQYFNKDTDYYKIVQFDLRLCNNLKPVKNLPNKNLVDAMIGQSDFSKRNLGDFNSYEEAYHQLITDIIAQQIRSVNLLMNEQTIKKLFVDGGFSKNKIYMRLLAEAFPQM
jgi:sugar (pentulose or hexulose) kinase